MPGTVKLKVAGWECPECGTGNDVLYVQCSNCDIEFEVVGVEARQQKEKSPGTASNSDYEAALRVWDEFGKNGNGIADGQFGWWVQQRLHSAKAPNVS